MFLLYVRVNNLYHVFIERHCFCFFTDPRRWTEAQAAHWFWWAYREFSVPEPPPTPLLRRVVCGGFQFQKFTSSSTSGATIMGRNSQIIRDRVRRERRCIRGIANNDDSESPTNSNDDDDDDDENDKDPDKDQDDDDDDDEFISSSSSNKPLYARKGKHLCNMGREQFVAEAPPFLGDILWEHLEMMQKGK